MSPLHCAAEEGHVEIVNLLLEKGVDVDIGANGVLITDDGASARVRCSGGTPLHCAAKRGQVEVAKILLARGADCAAVRNVS